MSWVCPQCAAQCRTAESYGIHVSRCRAMSVEEIEEVLIRACPEMGTWTDEDENVTTAAKAIHAFHIAKLRGKKERV